MTAVTEGSEALLQGTVIDTSAGTTQYGLTKRFPDGVAAVSETDMKAWMEYVYEYQSLSGHLVTGVPVSIDAADPNGNFVHLGDATSDGTGQFALKWTTPLVPGMYTVVVTFGGSESYYPSHAETHMIVSAAPAATPPIEFPQPIDNTLTIVAMGIVLLIAIVIVGILLLRKK
jgi:FAD/FMN-containing dehydrogenase